MEQNTKNKKMSRHSGPSTKSMITHDNGVYNAAKQDFNQQVKRNFIYEVCWHVLKDYPKFWFEVGFVNKRQFFNDIHAPINLDEDKAPINPKRKPNPNLNLNIKTLF